jgi:hypothetical protein
MNAIDPARHVLLLALAAIGEATESERELDRSAELGG